MRPCALVATVSLCVFTASAWADTVRLKNGRTIEGHVVREDQTQIIIAVAGGSEVVAASDVESIRYSDHRLHPVQSSERMVAPSAEVTTIDTALLERARTRLLAFHRFRSQMRMMLQDLGRGNREAAGKEGQRAAQGLLPTTSRGAFSPLSALADVVVLLGLRVPLLWLALVLLRERRSVVRMAELIVLGYCLAMLLMVGIGAAYGQSLLTGLLVELIGVSLLAVALGVLFFWFFALGWPKTIIALALAAILNVGLEYFVFSLQGR